MTRMPRTYDDWKCTNPDDEFLGPEPCDCEWRGCPECDPEPEEREERDMVKLIRNLAIIAHDRNPVDIVRGEALNPIWWRGRQWAVTDYGIEKLDGTYNIAKDRMREDHPDYSWIMHMATKNWIDLSDFTTAYMVAIVLHENQDLGDLVRKHFDRAVLD